jgi:hypothetical protein
MIDSEVENAAVAMTCRDPHRPLIMECLSRRIHQASHWQRLQRPLPPPSSSQTDRCRSDHGGGLWDICGIA